MPDLWHFPALEPKGGKTEAAEPETEPTLQQRRPSGAFLVLSQQQSVVLPQHQGEYVQYAQLAVMRQSAQHAPGFATFGVYFE